MARNRCVLCIGVWIFPNVECEKKTDYKQTYISCIITGPLIGCESLKKYFEENECASPTDVRHQTASLYYAYAVDTVTNLMS